MVEAEIQESVILLKTIAVMATISLINTCTQDAINEIFEIHKQSLKKQGFDEKVIEDVLQSIVEPMVEFKQAR